MVCVKRTSVLYRHRSLDHRKDIVRPAPRRLKLHFIRTPCFILSSLHSCQILQRDLSVAVLRVLRRVKDGGGLENFVFSDVDASPRERLAAGGTARAPEWDAQYPSRTVLRVW